MQILRRAAPGAANPCPALDCQNQLSQCVNHPVAPQCPLGRERRIIVFLTEVEHVLGFQIAVQSIRHHADYLTSGVQTSLLGGLIGGFLGGRLFPKVSAGWLRYLFAAFLLYGGIRYLL